MKDIVTPWLEKFGKALASGDLVGAAALFGEECYWRDLAAFTWTLKTFEGRDAIMGMLAATLGNAKPCDFQPLALPVSSNGVTEAWFAYSNEEGEPYGLSTAPLYAEMARPPVRHQRLRLRSLRPEEEQGLYAEWSARR